MDKPLPSTVKPEPPKPNKPIAAPNIDPNFDFKGYRRDALPYWILKAAKHGAVQGHVIVARIECVMCKRLMWTCEPRREDTCEECDFTAHEENRELRNAQLRKQFRDAPVVNPFADTDEPSDGVVLRR